MNIILTLEDRFAILKVERELAKYELLESLKLETPLVPQYTPEEYQLWVMFNS